DIFFSFIFIRMGLDTRDARVHGFTTSCCSAVEQQSIEHGARVNHQRARHLKTRSMAFAGNQFRGMDFFFGLRAAEKEGIFFDGLVGQAPSAGLFPGEVLVKQRDVEPRACELFAAEGASRSSANYGYLFHSLGIRVQTRFARPFKLQSIASASPAQTGFAPLVAGSSAQPALASGLGIRDKRLSVRAIR